MNNSINYEKKEISAINLVFQIIIRSMAWALVIFIPYILIAGFTIGVLSDSKVSSSTSVPTIVAILLSTIASLLISNQGIKWTLQKNKISEKTRKIAMVIITVLYVMLFIYNFNKDYNNYVSNKKSLEEFKESYLDSHKQLLPQEYKKVEETINNNYQIFLISITFNGISYIIQDLFINYKLKKENK